MADVRWNSKEFEYYPKTNGWYWTSIGIAVLLLVVAIWQKNYAFAAFIVIGEIMILVWSVREPRTIEVVADSRGITIDSGHLRAYNDLAGFSMRDDAEEAHITLVLRYKQRMHTDTHIAVPREKIAAVREALSVQLPETEAEPPSLVEALQKFFGF